MSGHGQHSFGQKKVAELGEFMIYIFMDQLNLNKLADAYDEHSIRSKISSNLTQGHLGGRDDYTVDTLKELLMSSENRLMLMKPDGNEQYKESDMDDLLKSDPYVTMKVMEKTIKKIADLCNYDTMLGRLQVGTQQLLHGINLGSMSTERS